MDAISGAGFDGIDGFDAVDASNASSASSASDVGAFRRGSPNTQWALGRYMVGRAVAEALSRGLLILAVAVFAVAALLKWGGSTFGMVIVGVVGVGVLVMRSLLLAVLRRISPMRADAAGHRMDDLVADTRRDVLRELRRIGLPGRTWNLPFLATRLIGRRRAETTQALRRFEVDRVVTPARLDELHMLLQSSTQRPTR